MELRTPLEILRTQEFDPVGLLSFLQDDRRTTLLDRPTFSDQLERLDRSRFEQLMQPYSCQEVKVKPDTLHQSLPDIYCYAYGFTICQYPCELRVTGFRNYQGTPQEEILLRINTIVPVECSFGMRTRESMEELFTGHLPKLLAQWREEDQEFRRTIDKVEMMQHLREVTFRAKAKAILKRCNAQLEYVFHYRNTSVGKAVFQLDNNPASIELNVDFSHPNERLLGNFEQVANILLDAICGKATEGDPHATTVTIERGCIRVCPERTKRGQSPIDEQRLRRCWIDYLTPHLDLLKDYLRICIKI